MLQSDPSRWQQEKDEIQTLLSHIVEHRSGDNFTNILRGAFSYVCILLTKEHCQKRCACAFPKLVKLLEKI